MDSIVKPFILNENCFILIEIPLIYVPKGPVDKNPALVQIMV